MTGKRLVKRALTCLCAICFCFGFAVLVETTQVKAETQVKKVITDTSVDQMILWDENTGDTDFTNPFNTITVDGVALTSAQIREQKTDLRPDVKYQKWEMLFTSSYLQSLETNRIYTLSYKANSSGPWTKTFKVVKAASDSVLAKTNTATICSHEYEWVEDVAATADSDAKLVYKCRKCGHIDMRMDEANSAYVQFLRESADKITKASQNGTVTIDTDKWTSFHRTVIDALAKRPDVTLIIKYTDASHNRRCIRIPAGTDLTGFIDENGYTGFEYLVSTGLEVSYWPHIQLVGQE